MQIYAVVIVLLHKKNRFLLYKIIDFSLSEVNVSQEPMLLHFNGSQTKNMRDLDLDLDIYIFLVIIL